jgi:hypothetical protein
MSAKGEKLTWSVCPLLAAGSTGWRNTPIFSKDGVWDETATSHFLLGNSTV